MPRYITDEDTFRVLSEYYHHRTDIQRMALSEAISRVPTADVVEVVRCKDCIHRDKYECNNITLGGTKCGVTDDWFCADGERKETEDESANRL